MQRTTGVHVLLAGRLEYLVTFIFVTAHRKSITETVVFVCLFELIVPVNSNGHDGTLPPFYGTFTQGLYRITAQAHQ